MAEFAKQLFRLVSRNSEDAETTARGPQQSRHQIHQRRLSRAVRPDQTGDTRRNREANAIDSEYLAIELRDVVEEDFRLRIADCGLRICSMFAHVQCSLNPNSKFAIRNSFQYFIGFYFA